MYCPYCGSFLPDAAPQGEGAKKDVSCPGCGRSIRLPEQKPQPASPLPSDAQPASPLPPDAQPTSPLPPDAQPTSPLPPDEPAPDDAPDAQPAKRKRSKKPIVIVSVLMVLLLLAGAAFAAYWFFFRKEKSGYAYLDGKDLYYADADGEPILLTTIENDSSAILRGRKYLFFNDGKKIYYADPENRKEPMLITDDADSLFGAGFTVSDNEKYVSFLSSGGTLYRFDLAAGDKTSVASKVRQFAVSDDADAFCVLTTEKELLYFESVDSGKEKISSDVESFFVSPDFKYVYFINTEKSLYGVALSDRAKNKIAADAQLASICFDDGSFYYLKDVKTDANKNASPSLCYYDGESHTVVSDYEDKYGINANWLAAIQFYPVWTKTPIAFYSRTDGKNTVCYAAKRSASYKLYETANTSGSALMPCADGKTVCWLIHTDGAEDLSLYSWFADRPDDKPALTDREVSGMLCSIGSGPLYYKTEGPNKICKLYCNKNFVSEISSRSISSETSAMIVSLMSGNKTGYSFFADYDSETGVGTLMYFDGKKCSKVAADASDMAYLASNDSVLFLTDVDKNGVGTLKLYNGAVRTVAEGVTSPIFVISLSTYQRFARVAAFV